MRACCKSIERVSRLRIAGLFVLKEDDPMSGYTRIYCIGGRRGGEKTPGIHPLLMEILVGEGDYQWWEPRYMDETIEPLGNIRVLIPEKPDHQNALIDACIAFFPDYFRECPLLGAMGKQLKDSPTLDFRNQWAAVPEHWPYLRNQARTAFGELHIFEADLKEVRSDNLTRD